MRAMCPLPTINNKNIILYFMSITAVAVFYFFAGSLSFSLSVSHDIVTLVVFFAEGGALAAVILFGKKIWPGIFIGQFVLAYTNGLALEPSFIISTINSVEAIIGAILFQKMGLGIKLIKVRDVALLLAIIVLVLQPFSATLGIATLWFFDVIQTESIVTSWTSWWFGNTLGQALVTPFFLTLFSRLRTRVFHREMIYDFAYTFAAGICVYMIFFNSFFTISSVTEVLAIITPIIIFIAAFRGQLAATGIALTVTIISLFSILFNTGHFSDAGVINWKELNIVLTSIVLVSQFISSLFEEKKVAIAKLHDREKMLSSILDNSPISITVNNMNGDLIFQNPAYKTIFGIPHKDDTLSPGFIFPLTENDLSTIENGNPIEHEHLVTLSDRDITLYTVSFPVFNADGNINSIVSMSSDITNNKILEEQLRRSQKMDALGKLTGGIAHDYNNMLGIVLGYAEILESSLSDEPDLLQCVNEITHAGERGAKLTKKLLSFSRHNVSDAKVLDLNAVLLNEQHMLNKTLTARIKLEFKLASDLWSVYLDESDLEDAIVNMSINAMHAIDNAGQLTIKTWNERLNKNDAAILQLESGDYVLLSITDTGRGMDAKTKEKIFEPFYSTKGEMGTGLGLSQVYGFVERSRGVIRVYSEPEHGSRFTLYFPRSSYNVNDDNAEQTKIKSEKDFTASATILVVDDETGLRNLTAGILRQQGYNVFCAESGKQALELLQQETIDLLFSDIIMPEMDGYQLTAIVQEKYPAIKIQLASGFSDGRHENMGDDTLHKNILNKPYHSESLLKVIRERLA